MTFTRSSPHETLAYTKLAAAEAEFDADVIIAGGGPVGLTLAYALGTRGVSVILVEPLAKPDTSSPRCKQVNPRSMEHFRRMGIAAPVRRAALPSGRGFQRSIFCTSLAGAEITRFDSVFALSLEPQVDFPEPGMWTAQYRLESELRKLLVALPTVRALFGSRVESVDMTDTGVSVRIGDGSENEVLRARYLAGADGSRSTVRKSMDVDLHGKSHTATNLQVIFKGEGLDRFDAHGETAQFWVINDQVSGVLGKLEGPDVWWVVLVDTDPDATDDDLIGAIRAMTGAPGGIEIHSRTPWTARMLIADRYRIDRTFLLGDAAHLNPPWGGFGANTGIGDAVDLGWKLAAHLQGWGGERLLDSYETERKAMARLAIAEAERNMQVLAPDLSTTVLGQPGPAGDAERRRVAERIHREKASEFYTLGFVLGSGCIDSPIVVPDELPYESSDTSTYRPAAKPGMRLPHVWLAPELSLYDLMGPGLTLIGIRGEFDHSPVDRLAKERSIPLKTIAIHRPDLHTLFGAAFVLVRPDHLVAWRGNDLPTDFAEVLDHARGAGIAAYT